MNPKTFSLLTFLCALPVALPAADAIQNVQTLGAVGFAYGESGFRFRVATNITVTSLGYLFRPSVNPASYVVQLLDGDGLELRAVTNSAPATTTNLFVYTEIDPLQLTEGTTNTLQAYDALYAEANAGAKLWEGYAIDTRIPGTGSFNVASQIEYLEAVTNGVPYYGSNAPSWLLVGPNLSFPTAADVTPSYLTIVLVSPDTARVSWPATDVLGTLQSATNISGIWTNVVQAAITNGASKEVDVPIVPPGAYFRLQYE